MPPRRIVAVHKGARLTDTCAFKHATLQTHTDDQAYAGDDTQEATQNLDIHQFMVCIISVSKSGAFT